VGKGSGHIEAGGESYRHGVLPPHASVVQVSETRKGFYAGAWFLLNHLMGVLDPGTEPTDADMTRMAEIGDELRAFAEKGGEG